MPSLILIGDNAANFLQGGIDNDTLDGGLNDDTLAGGGGLDTAQFTGLADAVVDLNKTGAQDTGYGLDTFLSIENLFGGDGNDHFIGDNSFNSLWGNIGNDTLEGAGGADALYGGEGDDVLDGGEGFDTVYFTGFGVFVDLSIIGPQDTQGEGFDRFVSIEALQGSSDIDTFIGNSSDNRLYGNDSPDILDGGLGNDVLDGGADQDTAKFSGNIGATVSLEKTGAQNTGYGFDTLIDIENLAGGAEQTSSSVTDGITTCRAMAATIRSRAA